MRWVLFAAVLATGCGKGETTTGASSAPPVEAIDPATARDYAEYVAELRKTVPVRVDEFKAKGLKCEPYVTSTLAGIEIFDSLTLTIEPAVVLKDALSGKTQRYVGAKMVRAGSGDVFATGGSADAAAARKNGLAPVTWDLVTLVPAPK